MMSAKTARCVAEDFPEVLRNPSHAPSDSEPAAEGEPVGRALRKAS